MPKLSVIVPVYNVEKYLPACIDSILAQTLFNLEVILIDDGSPDRCGEICDAYTARDCRVKVIHQTNHGVSSARNAGLAISTGDFIGFVDPDDWVAPESYAVLLEVAEKQHSPIAVCGFVICQEDGALIETQTVPAGIYSQQELLLSIYGMPNRLHGSMCNKLFARSLLEGLHFDESVAIGEDWLLLYECYCRAQRAVAVTDCFYYVRRRKGSATRTAKPALYVQKVETYLRLCDLAENHGKTIQRQAAAKALDACFINKSELKKLPDHQKALSFVNRKLRQYSLNALLQGTIPFKKAVYYFMEGLRV